MKSELTFQSIVESSPIAILLVNKEGTISYINHYGEQLFGYTRSELVGQAIELLIPKRYHGHHHNYRNGFMGAPKTMAFGAGRNLFAIKKNQAEFPVEISLAPIVTSGGTITLASIIDITARKMAEQNFELVIEKAPNAMILVNSRGEIVLVNKQAEDVFGYEKNDFLGNSIDMLVPEKYRTDHHSRRDGFFHAPSATFIGEARDLYGVRRSGAEFPVEIGLNPITIDNENFVVASVIDITQRKQAEEIINKQMTELEFKNRELEQFNYIASHDLQDPLRTVLNYIQLIEEDYADELNEDVMIYLKDMNAAIERMTVLVKSILDYGRLGKGRKLTKVNCSEALKNVLYNLNGRIQEHEASIKLDKLPVLFAYERELMQLFQNLINNAIKFKKEDVRPEIKVGCNETKSGYEFYVADNGIGIDPKYHNRIFNMFQRLHKAEAYEGHGVGLANCKKIIELHGGKIWVESEPGYGTTFKFLIPLLNNA